MRGLASTTVAPPTDISRAAVDVMLSTVPSSDGVVPAVDVIVSPHGGEVVSPELEKTSSPGQDELASPEQGKSVTGVQEDPAATVPDEILLQVDDPVPVDSRKTLSPSFSRFLAGSSKNRGGVDTTSIVVSGEYS